MASSILSKKRESEAGIFVGPTSAHLVREGGLLRSPAEKMIGGRT